MSFKPANTVAWTEIPVTDLDKGIAFYETVFDFEISRVDNGPNPIAVFSASDQSGISGHLYPGKPADQGQGGGVAMAQAAEEALIKIDAVLPDQDREKARSIQVHAMTMPQMDDALRKRIDQLEDAIDAKKILVLAYVDDEGRESQRPVRPLGLWFWGKVWTLVAWCELRDDFRMFRVDRIADVKENGTFKPVCSKSLAAFYAQQAAHGMRHR